MFAGPNACRTVPGSRSNSCDASKSVLRALSGYLEIRIVGGEGSGPYNMVLRWEVFQFGRAGGECHDCVFVVHDFLGSPSNLVSTGLVKVLPSLAREVALIVSSTSDLRNTSLKPSCYCFVERLILASHSREG